MIQLHVNYEELNVLVFFKNPRVYSVNSLVMSKLKIFFFFQVFALGNKTYEHYNAMGKYVDKRIEELGGERVFELGMGDDDGK